MPARPPKTFAASSGSIPKLGGRSPPKQQSDEVLFYKRQLAEQSRKHDQEFIMTQFVTFCEPAYTSKLPLSAWVLFRCLVHWDGFGAEGRDFRELLLDNFEQLSKKPDLNQKHVLYWISSLVSLLYLLGSHLPAISRSDVAKANAVAMFKERVQDLASSLILRSSSIVLAELDPVIAPALLEHAGLENNGRDQMSKSRGAKITVDEVIKILNQMQEAVAAACLQSSIAAQLFVCVAHGATSMTLNSLLDDHPGLCTFSNGLQMKAPIYEFKNWFEKLQYKTAASKVAPLEEVVNVLCMNKGALVEAEVRADVCPHLSGPQLSQLLLLYTPDSFDSDPIHPGVLAALCGDDHLTREDYCAEVELQIPLVVDVNETAVDVKNITLPKSVMDQDSLAFLRSSNEQKTKTDAW
jgi:hypothetical protein